MVKSATVNPSTQPEKPKRTRGGQNKASKEAEEIPPTAPAQVPTAPKKRGRKPKQVATVADKQPSQGSPFGDDPGAACQPASGTVTGKGVTMKKPTPCMREPLPVREGRNTHPGLREGIQPTPCRSSQEVAAERERKRQELEDRLHAAEEAKRMLARMELDDEKYMEDIETECHQPFDHRQQGKILPIPECEYEEFEGLDEIDSEDEEADKEVDEADEEVMEVEKDKDEDEDTGKAKVRLSLSIDGTNYLPASQGKAKCEGRKVSSKTRTILRKEIRDKADVLRGNGGKKNEGGKVK